jgi:nucleoside-diphosphate-sugar epimerase
MGKQELTTLKGTGFLGAHLIELLLRDKHDVVVLDNFLTSQPSDLDHLAAHACLQVIR